MRRTCSGAWSGSSSWARFFGREDEAAEVFDDVAERVEAAAAEGPLGRTVAFFYINEDGAAVTRRDGDYFCQMIEAAGGEYVSFAEEGAADSSPTTITVEMERFYEGARGADVIVYNGTIDEGVTSLEGAGREELPARRLPRRARGQRLDLRLQPLPADDEHG